MANSGIFVMAETIIAFFIKACSAKEGKGLQEGLDWLTDKLMSQKK